MYIGEKSKGEGYVQFEDKSNYFKIINRLG